ncbi:MAG: C25 family peptidase propeptide domain-containing protein, partial [Candidatus Promineifilaceae bacterium]
MKNRKVFVPFIGAVLMMALFWTTLQAAQQNSSATKANQPVNDSTQQNPITNLTTTSDSVSFLLNTPKLSENAAAQVEIPGLNSRTSEPGSPDLPFYATYIALPPGAEAEVAVTSKESAVFQNWTVTAVPDPQSAADVQDGSADFAAINEDGLKADPNSAVFEKDGDYPASLYEVSEPMYVRDVRLVSLKLYPLQYNPVSHQLTQHQLEVTVQFIGGGNEEARPLPGQSPLNSTLEGLVLNADQAQNWRGLPENMSGTGTLLPVGSDAYKIEVNEDGIYEVTYADLQAAGMNVNSVNPQTFQMLYRGQPVAYAFVGDGDSQFESGELVRFYGWAFNGSRLEHQFINNNVFWLWANGTPDAIGSVASQSGTVASTFLSSITTEPETIWYPTWTDQWDSFPNEPDAWYWKRLTKGSSAPMTTTVTVDLPNPAASGPDAAITAEFSSKLSPSVGGNQVNHEMVVQMNNDPNVGSLAWMGKQNVNI